MNSEGELVVLTCGPVALGRPLLSFREVDQHRHLTCAQYEACLDVAVSQRWKGWSCSMCPHSADRAPPPADETSEPDYDLTLIDR